MAAAEGALLGVVFHVQLLAGKLLRAADVEQGLAGLRMGEHLVAEGPDLIHCRIRPFMSQGGAADRPETGTRTRASASEPLRPGAAEASRVACSEGGIVLNSRSLSALAEAAPRRWTRLLSPDALRYG